MRRRYTYIPVTWFNINRIAPSTVLVTFCSANIFEFNSITSIRWSRVILPTFKLNQSSTNYYSIGRWEGREGQWGQDFITSRWRAVITTVAWSIFYAPIEWKNPYFFFASPGFFRLFIRDNIHRFADNTACF